MELTKEQISSFAKAFNVSKIFLENIASECNNISELQEILLKIHDVADENNIPLEVAEKFSYIKKLIENESSKDIEVKLKALKLPKHECPLMEFEQNCYFCPLHPKNLIEYTLFNCEKFYESTGKKANIQLMMEAIVEDLVNNPNKLRMHIKQAYEIDLKNKFIGNN